MRIDDEWFSILDELIIVSSPHEYCIKHVHIWTSKHNSAYIKGSHIQIYFINKINTDRKSNLQCFVTFSSASLCTYPNGYGFGCSWTSSRNLLTRSAAMRFSYDPESNRASIFIFLPCIFTWKSLVIYFSSYCWRLLIFTSFHIDVHMIFSSTFELLSTWLLESVAMRFLLLLSFFLFFGFGSRCNF